jgi:hypothetical protein
MSLTNEWADGGDSIQNPRNRSRSPDDGTSGARRVPQKGRRSRYGDADQTDMVAAGYTNNDHDDNHDSPWQGNTYYGSSSQSAKRDSRTKTEWRQRRNQPPPSTKDLLNGGVPSTPTSTRMAGENRHTSSSSAMNSFGSAKHSRRRCAQTWQTSSSSREP